MRPRVAGVGLSIAVLAGACTGAGTTRTQAPAKPPASVVLVVSSATPARTGVSPATPGVTAPATPGVTAPVATVDLPTPDPADPTPIAADGRLAPAPQDLVVGDQAFDLADLRGHPVLLFFGYTHCPDVCPMTIGELVVALGERPDARAVFISIDPERDTPESLAKWVSFLPEGFVAVTGSPAAIRQAADAWGVRYARVDSGSAAGYSMSHTAFVYLIDAEGRHRSTFPFGTGWASLVRAVDGLSVAQEDGS
jgi:protein SCO1/2